jgi:4-hydroxyphenylpyruvate dioxygenase-like putative hemolysin
MIQRIDHIDIAVDDVEATAAFFLAFGYTEVKRSAHAGLSIELRLPGDNQPIIELTTTRKPNGTTVPAGLRHIALRSSDIKATQASLAKNGVAVDADPKMINGRMLMNAISPAGGVSLQIVEG